MKPYRCPECGWTYWERAFSVGAWRWKERPTIIVALRALMGCIVLVAIGYFIWRMRGLPLGCNFPLALVFGAMGLSLGYQAVKRNIRHRNGTEHGKLFGSRRTLAYWEGDSRCETVRWKDIDDVRLEPKGTGWRLTMYTEQPSPRLDVFLTMPEDTAKALRRLCDERILSTRREVETNVNQAPEPPAPALELCPWCGRRSDLSNNPAYCPRCRQFLPRQSLSLECWRSADLPRWWNAPVMASAGLGMVIGSAMLLWMMVATSSPPSDVLLIIVLAGMCTGACFLWVCIRMALSKPGGPRRRVLITPQRLIVFEGKCIDWWIQRSQVRTIEMARHREDYWQLTITPSWSVDSPLKLIIRAPTQRAVAIRQYLLAWVGEARAAQEYQN